MAWFYSAAAAWNCSALYTATYAVRIKGDSMTGVGIYPGDIAVVNRAGNVADGLIIIAMLGGEFTLKRYRCRGGKAWLQAENPAYADILLSEESDFYVFGVVEKSIRMF